MCARLTLISLAKIALIWVIILLFFYVFIHKEVERGNTDLVKKKSSSPIFDKLITEKYGARGSSNFSSSALRRALEATTKSVSTRKKLESVCGPGRTWVEGLTTIYMVTPTYRRAEQIPELTRTAQTLLHVKNLIWIVVEDAPKPSQEVIDYLASSGMKYVYLRAQMPDKFSKDKRKPRGVANRNAGIEWIKKHATGGVVYFGDDDNTYDLRIFEEIRSTKGVSMFPVGLVTQLGVSSPIVMDGKVVGFYDGWISNRKFPVDMAGFAISVKLFLKNPKATMPFKVGYEEDGLLKNLKIKPSDIEPKAENCTKIWVWHTQTTKNKPAKDSTLKSNLEHSNLAELKQILWRGV